jgi:hypothetical protein
MKYDHSMCHGFIYVIRLFISMCSCRSCFFIFVTLDLACCVQVSTLDVPCFVYIQEFVYVIIFLLYAMLLAVMLCIGFLYCSLNSFMTLRVCRLSMWCMLGFLGRLSVVLDLYNCL